MKSKRYLYGFMGLLSLLGFIGIYCGMISVALVSFACFFAGLKEEKEALITGLASGWAVSVLIYALSVAYYGFKEKWGMENDKE